MSFDPTSITLFLAIFPALAVLIAWKVLKKGGSKKDLWFLLGFLCLAEFYIFAPDPSLIYKLYVENGDLKPVAEFASISACFLFVAVYFFKKHREGAAQS